MKHNILDILCFQIFHRMFCKAITGVVLAIGSYVVLTQLWYAAYPEEIAATLPEDVNWGARQPESLKDDGIRPFTITTSPAVSTYSRIESKPGGDEISTLSDTIFRYPPGGHFHRFCFILIFDHFHLVKTLTSVQNKVFKILK